MLGEGVNPKSRGMHLARSIMTLELLHARPTSLNRSRSPMFWRVRMGPKTVKRFNLVRRHSIKLYDRVHEN